MSVRQTTVISLLVAPVALSTVLSSCSTSTADFRKEAEKFIESKDLANEAGYTFSNAVCDQPASTKVGDQFACSATDNDGDDWTFIVEITGDRELTVVSGDVVGSNSTP